MKRNDQVLWHIHHKRKHREDEVQHSVVRWSCKDDIRKIKKDLHEYGGYCRYDKIEQVVDNR